MKKILVTGGAGFIGSNLVEKLLPENDVVVFDNFSGGKKNYLPKKCKIIKGDVLNEKQLEKALKGVDVCYHLAADPRVRESFFKPIENFKIDFLATLKVLEACRKNDVKSFIFASSSVVYGNAAMPTPETAAISPVSNYGAAKASCENYLMSYSTLYGIKATILRFANIIGPHSTHGIIFDFFSKLRKNPKELEIFGDGSQKKSYLHVYDCVDAVILVEKFNRGGAEIYNVGSEEQLTANEIARLVIERMGLKNVKYKYGGGSKGWPGDIPVMLLSIEKLKSLGWRPKFSSKESVIAAVDFLKSYSKN